MLLTLAEAARRLGLSEKTAREVLREVTPVRVGKRFRWNSDAIAEFAKSGQRGVAVCAGEHTGVPQGR